MHSERAAEWSAQSPVRQGFQSPRLQNRTEDCADHLAARLVLILIILLTSFAHATPREDIKQRIRIAAAQLNTVEGRSAWLLARIELVHELASTGDITGSDIELANIELAVKASDTAPARLAILEARILVLLRTPDQWDRAKQLLDEAEQTASADPDLTALILLSRAEAANQAQHYEDALATLARIQSSNPERRAQALNSKAVTLHHIGQLHAAKTAGLASLDALAQHSDSALKARIRANLSLILARLGELAEAKRHAEAAIEPLQARTQDRANAQALASALLTRASIRVQEHGDTRADFGEAVRLMEKHFGPRSPALLPFLTSQGFGLVHDGALDEASIVLQRGLAIARDTKIQPAFQLSVLEELCHLRFKQQRIEEAQQFAATIRDISRERFPDLIAAGSESDRLAQLRECRWVDAALAAHDDALAAEATVATYGVVFDSLLRDSALAARLPSDQRQRYRETKAKLAALALHQQSAIEFTDLRRLLLETEGRFHLEDTSITALQKTLQNDEALVVFSPYRRFDGKPTERLAAAIVTAQATRIVRLSASCDALRSLGDALSEALRKRDEDKALSLIADLRTALWEPLQLADTKHLYLCLDASMQRVPVTIWDREVTFLTSPRALVRKAPPARALPAAWLLIDAGQQRLEFPSKLNFPYTITAGFNDHALPALPGAGVEVRALFDAHPQRWLVLSSDIGQPQESAFVAQLADPPAVIHFAGHATSLDPGIASSNASSKWWQGIEQPDALWASALFFPLPQPAESIDDLNTDNLLFAAEITGLDLTGTQLVTLSACESGAGISPVSEGSYSLARAFHTAGVRDVLTCTEQVPDASVIDLMQPFYERVIAGEDAARALWQEQRKLLQTNDLKALRAFGYFRLTRAWK